MTQKCQRYRFMKSFENEFGGPDLSTYIWMCPVGNYFFLGLYVFAPIESGRFGNTSDLSLIRMALSNLTLNSKSLEFQAPAPPSLVPNPTKDYYDIDLWLAKPHLYKSFMTCKGQE